MAPPCSPDSSKRSLAAEMLRDFGELWLRVSGTSMLPSVWPEDLLLIRRVGAESLVAGDLVLYTRGERWFVHRLVKKEGVNSRYRLFTRGDALSAMDAPISIENVLGRVAAIERRGRRFVPGLRLALVGRAFAWLHYYASGMSSRFLPQLQSSRQTRTDSPPA